MVAGIKDGVVIPKALWKCIEMLYNMICVLQEQDIYVVPYVWILYLAKKENGHNLWFIYSTKYLICQININQSSLRCHWNCTIYT